MKRFIEGEDRSQATLLPACLDDYIAEDNPVRAVDAFVEEFDLHGTRLCRCRAGRDRPARVSPGGAAQALHLRLSEPHRLQSPARARSAAQRRADVAHRPAGARLQDHRRLPARQRRRHPRGVSPLRAAVPGAEALHPGDRGHRQQQVQGGQQPRPQLHAEQGRPAPAADRAEHPALSGCAGDRRPHPAGGSGSQDRAAAREDRDAARADAAHGPDPRATEERPRTSRSPRPTRTPAR